MICTRREFTRECGVIAALTLSACAQAPEEPPAEVEEPQEEPVEEVEEEEERVDLREFERLEFNNRDWQYDEENDVYYQLNVPYCLHPGSVELESLAIFVPGPYFIAEQRRKSYECTIDETARIGDFSAATAPILMPINSGTFSPQSSPASYSYEGLAPYLNAGFIYVYAGFRGRSSGYVARGGRPGDSYSGGAPWPVVDLKAAVRYLRYNALALPGDTDRICLFGFSGGGGISALMGASGDAGDYVDYLNLIGAATHDSTGEPLSDAIFASASWCPITSFDSSDASYEWMMGQYSSDGDRADKTWTKLLSNDLARSYATYLNDAQLCAEPEVPLTLEESEAGIYAQGSYYDHLISIVNESATAFFETCEFPYTYKPDHLVNSSFPGDPDLMSTKAGASDIEAITRDDSAMAAEEGSSLDSNGLLSDEMTFASDTDYVNYLNHDAWWLTYNQRRKSAFISSLADFTKYLKCAAKGVCAFDAPDRSKVENQLFGVDDATSLHFSSMIADCIVAGRESYAEAEGFDEIYVTDWTGDLTEIDALERTIQDRVSMFNPLYYVCAAYEGYGSAVVAPHWRINSGIFQTDTSLCTEANLTLALKACEGVEDVSFTPVWGQGHVLAERSGDAQENLISWVLSLCPEKTPPTESETTETTDDAEEAKAADEPPKESEEIQTE